jgi:hypothetical protein
MTGTEINHAIYSKQFSGKLRFLLNEKNKTLTCKLRKLNQFFEKHANREAIKLVDKQVYGSPYLGTKSFNIMINEPHNKKRLLMFE